jgi:hypothetical protein
MNPKISADHLKRRAIVYIRQSSPGQVIHNQESQRRQYGLADHARQLGFQRVEIIDEDLGRSGSGQVERPGFQHLVAEVCTGEVGAVLCIEASRLARNGRDWHHLIELCGLVRAIVIDPDGVYDPGILNDRLLLGLKGTMSEKRAIRTLAPFFTRTFTIGAFPSTMSGTVTLAAVAVLVTSSATNMAKPERQVRANSTGNADIERFIAFPVGLAGALRHFGSPRGTLKQKINY